MSRLRNRKKRKRENRTGMSRRNRRSRQHQNHLSQQLPWRTRTGLPANAAMNIPEHRKAIDKLDAQIVKLLNERTRHVLEIGEIKLKAGEEIYAPHREQAVFNRICKLNEG